MGIRQPGVQGCKPHLCAVAEEQEDEGDIEKRGVEGGRMLDQDRPDHGVIAFAHHRLGSQIDENRPEQGKRDADAAENKVLPRRLERFVGPVDADHKHCGQRRKFDRHPHQPDIVRDEGEVHPEHHDLVHRVVEAEVRRCQPADLQFMGNVAGAEHAGCEADEGVEDNEDDVEVIDQEILPGLRSRRDEERKGRKKGEQARDHVEPGGEAIAGQNREHYGRHDRNDEDRAFCVEGEEG